jgi:hypothetical protein
MVAHTVVDRSEHVSKLRQETRARNWWNRRMGFERAAAAFGIRACGLYRQSSELTAERHFRRWTMGSSTVVQRALLACKSMVRRGSRSPRCHSTTTGEVVRHTARIVTASLSCHRGTMSLEPYSFDYTGVDWSAPRWRKRYVDLRGSGRRNSRPSFGRPLLGGCVMACYPSRRGLHHVGTA